MKKRYLASRFGLFFSLGLILFTHPACESRKGSEQKPKTNSPPTITSITLLPEKAYQGSELNLILQSTDPDGDSIKYKYQWIKNDQEFVGENESSLKGQSFRKGDFIQVKVTPSDGKVAGPSSFSSSVKILNSAPVVQGVWIEPKIAYASDNLKAQVKSFDLDADFVYYAFHWEKNGKVIPEEKAQVLEQGQFKKGDSIAVIVIPDDREIQGTPRRSDPVLISNSPPMITSSPPASVEGTTYRYHVKAIDPDQDPVTFSLKSGPKGMAIDKNTGLIQWEVGKEDKGTHSIEIEATDNEGAKSTQPFTLAVDFK
ncbi:MAG: hypothetical protein A2157_05495 [Deltaproteobacteria bacterium RBG_16_47_11]|nr:MAG: hypothetical protein A2157_05495 [Deltaproteobacteria bacterium RBG_16_47_11]